MRDGLDAFRSALFVPAHDEAKAAKVATSGADAIILDLEDAVLPDLKPEARMAAARYHQGQASPLIMIRVNAVGTPWHDEDVEAASKGPASALVLPKADARAMGSLPENGLPILALIETATGLRDCVAIAEHPRVFGLFLGGVDLAADMRLEPRVDGLELLHARGTVVMASAAAGLRPPVDVVHVDFRNEASLLQECELARSMGFGAKACIHPAQVAPVNAAFSPSAAQCASARAIVDAFRHAQESGAGVIVVAGRMVDLPVVRWAERVLRQAEEYGQVT